MQLPSALLGLSPNFFPKLFPIFSSKTCSKNVSYIFSKKSFSNFQETELSLFRVRYIQNPDIIRTRSIFKTLVYSVPEAYSEHYKTSTMECFAKPVHFLNLKHSLNPSLKNKKKFTLKKVVIFSCISGKGNFWLPN